MILTRIAQILIWYAVYRLYKENIEEFKYCLIKE